METQTELKMETQTEIAKHIAIEAHAGQVRKLGDDKGKPYIIHPERVANHFMNDTLCAAAWLHDVLEDCPGYSTKLLQDVGIHDDVIALVVLLTHDPTEKYVDYLIRIADNFEASQLKHADLLDNLKSCPPGNMRDKYELAKYILENY